MFRRPLTIVLAGAFLFAGACRKDSPVPVPVPPPDAEVELEPEVDDAETEDEAPAEEAFEAEDDPPEIVEPAPEPAVPEPSDMELAELEFEKGNLEAAVHLYESAISDLETPPENRAHALLRSAVAYLLPDSPSHDPERGKERIEALVEEFPENPLVLEASLILMLLEERSRLESENRSQAAQIEDLTNRLDALKRIDLRRGEPRPPR